MGKKRYTSNKDVNAFIDILINNGWFICRSKNHLILEHSSTKQRLPIPKSTSDYRSLQNIKKKFTNSASWGK